MRATHRVIFRLALAALCVMISGTAALARSAPSPSAMPQDSNGWTLAPAFMGNGAGQPGADPNAVLNLNLGQEVNTADPQVESFGNELTLSGYIFASLLTINPYNQLAANGASAMSVSPDGKTYTFTIRPGMTYSDGQPVTAGDYAFAIKRACDPAVGGEYSNILFIIDGCAAWRTADLGKTPASRLRQLEGTVGNAIRALDAQTLRIQIRNPAGYFPYIMTTFVTYPSRPDLVKAGGTNWWKNPKYYIGNGPFKVVRWTPRQQWVLARNDHYFLGKSGIARVVFKEVFNSATALLAYMQGQFDMVGVDPTQVAQVEGTPALKAQLHRSVGGNTSALVFDNADPPFNNVKVRQAFASAMNRQQYINQVDAGLGAPSGTLLWPSMPGYQTSYQQTYNPAIAQRLLAEAGYPGGRGFPTVPLDYPNVSVTYRQKATFWAQEFKQVLNVNIQATPLDPAMMEGLMEKQSPVLKMYGEMWSQDYPHPQDLLSLVFGNGSAQGPRGWNDPHFNALVNRADTLPIAEATPLYQQADAYLAQQAPVAFYMHSLGLTLISPNIKGCLHTPTNSCVLLPQMMYKTRS